MSETIRQRLAHICILVRDIDQAIEHYRNILAAASPGWLKQEVVKEECLAGKDRYVTTFSAHREMPATSSSCSLWIPDPLFSSAWRKTERACTISLSLRLTLRIHSASSRKGEFP